MKRVLSSIVLFLAFGLFAPMAWAEADYWPEEYVETFASIPVQDDGRVKPMDTYARFMLISMHGRSKLTLDREEGIKISATEWLLDMFFRPDVARDYPTFEVNNAEVLTRLELAPHLKESGQVKKRDFYAYNELEPARQKVRELSEVFVKIDDKERSVVERQIVNLDRNMRNFEGLMLLFQFAHTQLPLDPNNIAAAEVPEGTKAPLSFLFENLEQVRAQRPVTASIRRSTELIGAYLQSSTMLPLFPGFDGDDRWHYPSEFIDILIKGEAEERLQQEALGRIKLMENLVMDATDPAKRMASLRAYEEEIVSGAKGLGVYDGVISEVSFYKKKNLLLGPWLYVVGFLFVAFSWLSPRSTVGRWLRWGAYGWLWIPTILLCVGITWRCFLQSRPPVTNLYETILFVTAVATVMLLIVEALKRNGLALAMVPVLGAAGLFLAMRFELLDGQDTISPVVAVLDTNYWLATHVTTVTMGYAAGLAAAAVSILYIFSRLVDPMQRRFPRAYYRDITGMTYGIICFGLLFSLVGTILGGVWANESWGRFWGWDPKENGALMIVIMNLFILHGRIGGFLKQMRLHLASVFGAIVVCYSWWGVNLLGAGLHNYGFTSGVQTALSIAYASLYSIMVIGTCVGLYQWAMRNAVETEGKKASRSVAAVASWIFLIGGGVVLLGKFWS